MVICTILMGEADEDEDEPDEDDEDEFDGYNFRTVDDDSEWYRVNDVVDLDKKRA